MKSRLYFIIGIIVALVFWFLDSFVHFYVYGEINFQFVPIDANLLWMRSVICALLILFGIFADAYTKVVVKRERAFEALKIYKSTLYATHHILNNLLNQLQLFRIEASKSQDFDKRILSRFDVALKEASCLIESLSNVREISEQSIKESIKPK